MDDRTQVRFHYIKSPSYAEYPVSGCFGGPSSSGGVFLSFFSERGPIPTAITYDVTDQNGEVKLDEVKREGRDGPIRFVHNGIYLDLGTAERLRDWLTAQIEAANRG